MGSLCTRDLNLSPSIGDNVSTLVANLLLLAIQTSGLDWAQRRHQLWFASVCPCDTVPTASVQIYSFLRQDSRVCRVAAPWWKPWHRHYDDFGIWWSCLKPLPLAQYLSPFFSLAFLALTGLSASADRVFSPGTSFLILSRAFSSAICPSDSAGLQVTMREVHWARIAALPILREERHSPSVRGRMSMSEGREKSSWGLFCSSGWMKYGKRRRGAWYVLGPQCTHTRGSNIFWSNPKLLYLNFLLRLQQEIE